MSSKEVLSHGDDRDDRIEAKLNARTQRRQEFSELLDFTKGHGLEIGPLDSGIADRELDDVRFVDVFHTPGVRAAYENDANVVLDLIPEIDYALIEDGVTRSLVEAVAPGVPYDWVIASHVIEHVPDMIGWLKEIDEVTTAEAALVLAVPDRRYTFDRHRPPTTTGQALEAHEQGATTPGIRAVYDFRRSAVDVDVAALRSGARPPGRETAMAMSDVQAELERVRAGQYVDCHVWTFTPQSFVSQIRELRELDLCGWYVETLVEPADGMEFRAVLRKVALLGDEAAVRAREVPLVSDMPDWLYDEWSKDERIRELEQQVERLRRRNRMLRRRVRQLESSVRMRLGSALLRPAETIRGWARPGPSKSADRRGGR